MNKAATLLILILCTGVVAFGQQNERLSLKSKDTSGQITEGKRIALKDVTVTAQKRPENQQEVPIAITSISSGFIENHVLETLAGLADFVPGVQVQEQSALLPGFVIRGQTSDIPYLNFDNRVSVFQDGVSISKQSGAYTEFFDMDQVEVLKGPQGTLFGRSAQIGAIHLITKRPVNETSGSLALGAGNYNHWRANGYVNVPLVKNKLFMRVAGIYNRRDGYVENLSGGTLMGKNTIATRASLKYLPDNRSSIDLIFNYERDKMPGTAFKSSIFAPKGGDTNPFTFVDLEQGDSLIDQRGVLGVTAQYKRNFSNALSLTAITAYRTVTSVSVMDADGTKAKALDFRGDLNYRQFSQEVRLNYKVGRFSGFAGANYFAEDGNLSYKLTQDERSVFAMLSPLLAAKIPGFKAIPMIINGEPNLALTVNPLTHKPFKTFHQESMDENGVRNGATDFFIDGSFRLTPKLIITAGGRLILENLTSIYRVDPAKDPGTLGFLLGKGVNNIFKPTNGRITASKTYADWVGRLNLQYDFTKEMMAWASWSKGRSPNVIQINSDTTEYLAAELVYNYEAGIKNMLFKNRLMFNFNAFHYNYKDFQTISADLDHGGIYRISDSGKATGNGVEAELQLAATKNLTLFANYAWLDARFDKLDSNGNPQKLAGNTFRLTPRNSGSGGVTYRLDLGKAGSLTANMTVTFKSSVFFEDENTPGLSQSGYALVNASLGYLSANGKYGVRLNMNNLANQRYLIDAGNTGLAFGIPTYVPGPPRFYGAQIIINL